MGEGRIVRQAASWTLFATLGPAGSWAAFFRLLAENKDLWRFVSHLTQALELASANR